MNRRERRFQTTVKAYVIQSPGRLDSLLGAVVLMIVMGMLTASPAVAHKVNVFAYVEGDRVIVDGYFSGGVKAQNSNVEVFDDQGKKLIEGKTDTKGAYLFKLEDLPAFTGGLKIVLEAEMGHRGEYNLAAGDIPRHAGQSRAQVSAPVPVAVEKATEKPVQSIPQESVEAKTPSSTSPLPQAMDEAGLNRTLESVLDKKLEPIVRMLGNQEKLLLEEKFSGPKMTDIIGGIGWILGLGGIAAFAWSFKRRS